MSTEMNSIDKKENIELDAEKRAFMKKFGKYTVGVGMATLMTPSFSSAGNYNSPDDNSVHYPDTNNNGGDNWKDDTRDDGTGA